MDESRAAQFRRILRATWILPALVVLWVAWGFYARHAADEAARQRARDADRSEAQKTYDMLGGNRFEILHFYAAPGTIVRGETAQLCYGVSNAKAARIEPPPGNVWPAVNRCLSISPAKTTEYTLTIEDASRQTKTAKVKVEVR